VKHLLLLGSALLAASCSDKPRAGTYTLYRNSNFEPSLRVHWATFDADESGPTYNMNNCQMAARLLNANLDAATEQAGQARPKNFGFWCEPGEYVEKGDVPLGFPAEYPTDVY
jgi:hypothetical protein